MSRRWKLFISTFVVAVLAVEGVALLALVGTGNYPDEPFGEIYANSACLTAGEFNYGKNVASPQDAEVMLGRIPHPFFGFVLNPAGGDPEWRRQTPGANFETELRYSVSLGEDPRPPEVFTIGIFGASVAVSFAGRVMEDERFAAALRDRIPALADRRIVLRNMAIGGSRQPSQLAIALQYMELFDMTINLDGYSEQAISMYPDYPIEFPMFGDIFFGEKGSSRYLALRVLADVCRAISRPGELPLLRHSNAYYLFWYVASAYSKGMMAEGRAEPGLSEDLPFTDEEVRHLYAAYYERYTRYQHQVLAGNGVRPYFFLQPNQYVPGAKTFSEEELGGAFSGRGADETAERYALLRRKVRDLSAQGVGVYDLTQVFADVEETVYVDSCCHVNARGNDLMAEAIVEIVAREENAGASWRRAD